MVYSDIIIIGGGLAGLTAALHLVKEGFSVVLLEKEDYPHHKVCGEYISNEVTPYLEWLDIYPASCHPVAISHLEFTATGGKRLFTPLPLGGFGLSRYTFDHFLYTRALAQGVIFYKEQVSDVNKVKDVFEITTLSGSRFTAKVVLGAFGKRSQLDIRLDRKFIKDRSPWLGIKAHYKGDHPDHVVSLHNFKGGYCGISKVEDNKINVCYLVHEATFRQYKNTEALQENVLCKNPALRHFFDGAQSLFPRPVTISQVSFREKPCVENGILMTGDSAGLINPLCGNGMAMAIHSAKLASGYTIAYLQNKISRTEMEYNYTSQWKQTFRHRIQTGHRLAGILQHDLLSGLLLSAFSYMPWLLPALIKKTHGKPVKTGTYANEYAEQKYGA